MLAESAEALNRQLATPDSAEEKSRVKLRSLPTGPQPIFTRPLEPLAESAPPSPPPEPAPWTATAEEWEIWVAKRDAHLNFNDQRGKARKYAEENDLRGTF